MNRWLVALVAVAGLPAPAVADPATAAAAFDQAAQLVRQGKWAEACDLFDASYRADPQLGSLLHLADCHEHIGKTASAWAEYEDAIELAHKKADPRESVARARAAALLPKVPKLHLAPPPKLIASLVVIRDGVDITALVGSDLPIDPGDHQLGGSAPGYVSWKAKVTIAGTGITPITIPALDPEAATATGEPKVHQGTLIIVTDPHAAISLDGHQVATGRFEGKLKSGGHTLRVVAHGMLPYQSEVTITDDEDRTIDVPLEALPPSMVPAEQLPSWEFGIGAASGVKLRGDDPGVLAYRAEIGLRLGRRAHLGAYVEAGSISASNSCGLSMPGPMASSPFDYGERDRFTRCSSVMPGVQIYVHLLPGAKLDPYVGIAPGIRFGFVSWVPYIDGQPQASRSELFPALVLGARIGVDYHPHPEFKAWQVGMFIEPSFTLIGKEAAEAVDSRSHDNAEAFVTILGGLRSTLAF